MYVYVHVYECVVCERMYMCVSAAICGSDYVFASEFAFVSVYVSVCVSEHACVHKPVPIFVSVRHRASLHVNMPLYECLFVLRVCFINMHMDNTVFTFIFH